jgi:hypothetical protein
MKDIPVCLSVEGAYRLVNEDLWLCGTLAYESSGFRGILELAPHLALRLGASYIIHDIQADQNPTCRLPYMSLRGVEDKIGPRIDLALRSETIFYDTRLDQSRFNGRTPAHIQPPGDLPHQVKSS